MPPTASDGPDTVHGGASPGARAAHQADAAASPGPPKLVAFLAVYAPALLTQDLAESLQSTEGLFLSVIVRTQGTRSALLREALLCLAAQDCDDFEVIVVLHDPAEESRTQVRDDAALLSAVRPGRVRILEATGGGRVRPVAVGLEQARGRYAVVLDDDDHVTADWVATFRELWHQAPGRILRAGAATRIMKTLDRRTPPVRVAASGTNPKYTAPWDFEDHVRENRTPIHAFAFPLAAVRQLGIQFDESLSVVEDWDFLLRSAGALGVVETAQVTAIYNHGALDSSSRAVHESQWRATEDGLRALHRASPRLREAPQPGSRSLRRRIDVRIGQLRRLGRSASYVYSTEGSAGVVDRVGRRVRGEGP